VQLVNLRAGEGVHNLVVRRSTVYLHFPFQSLFPHKTQTMLFLPNLCIIAVMFISFFYERGGERRGKGRRSLRQENIRGCTGDLSDLSVKGNALRETAEVTKKRKR